MAGHTTANLREVQNQAPNLGLSESDVELRMARVPLECSDCGVSYLRLAPGFRQPDGHSHRRQEEIYVLVNGSARIKVGDEVVELRPWDAIRIPPDSIRALEAGLDGAEFLAVGAPNTGPGDGVVERGWWSS
jgi:mannose-6-phosphate isomerase-like protein (cupin superfamily)